MAPIPTFVQRKTDTAIAVKNTIFAIASRIVLLEDIEVYDDIIEEEPSRLNSGRKEPPSKSSSRRQWKNHHTNGKVCHYLGHSHSSKSLKGRTSCRQSRNQMMRYYRRINDMTATVEHETVGQNVIHHLSAIEKKNALAIQHCGPSTCQRPFKRSFRLLDIQSC